MRKERLDREKSERLRAEELVKELKEGKLSNANDDPYKHKYTKVAELLLIALVIVFLSYH